MDQSIGCELFHSMDRIFVGVASLNGSIYWLRLNKGSGVTFFVTSQMKRIKRHKDNKIINKKLEVVQLAKSENFEVVVSKPYQNVLSLFLLV
jgi:hypothetical protein